MALLLPGAAAILVSEGKSSEEDEESSGAAVALIFLSVALLFDATIAHCTIDILVR
jgi:hypothetical protein